MSTKPQTDYDALAAWAESDESTVQPGTTTVRGTPETHAAVRAMLEEAAEADEEKVLLASVRGGRPSLSPRTRPGAASPMWRVRVPEDLNEATRARRGRGARPVRPRA